MLIPQESVFHFPHCPDRISRPKSRSHLPPESADTVWFCLNIQNIEQLAKGTAKDLDQIHFLIIPCSALKEAHIPGFEEGCF
jgi:hypothetical protein